MNRLIAILGLFWCCCASAAEVIPPAPTLYFNDYSGIISLSTAGQLNQQLADFERATSSQIVVAVFPKMESDSSIEDYTVRVARAWKVGQKDKNNGVVLFVFMAERRMSIKVGYGLEGALPDGLCKRIIDQEITPRFKLSDYDGGLKAGIAAIMAATKGEYQGNGLTALDSADQKATHAFTIFIAFVAIVLFMVFGVFLRGQAGWLIGGMLSGSSWGNGGWSGGGGGGFSGGGGSFGGGGASGSW